MWRSAALLLGDTHDCAGISAARNIGPSAVRGWFPQKKSRTPRFLPVNFASSHPATSYPVAFGHRRAHGVRLHPSHDARRKRGDFTRRGHVPHDDQDGPASPSYKAIAGCALAAGLLAATLGGVQAAQAFQSDAATGEEYQADLEQRWEETAQEYAPEVTTLEDGTQVQRTPYDTSYFQMYYVNGGDLSYNTRYLDADNRGCNACHDDLAQVLRNMDFFHLELDNGLGTTTTVDDCRICHDYGYGYVDDPGEFGNTIHGIHNKSGVVNNCMTCHAATADGQGMQLWDDVKYDVMQGIGSVADVQGEFSYRQDVTTPMFDASWYYTETNTSNIARGYAGEELDMDVFDTWEVTVSGLVEQPFTAKLTDLIDEAPLVTTTVAMECIMNAPGGEAIANMEVTGIPISWLLEKAGGVKDGATAIMSYAPDGWGRASDFARYEETDGYLIFKVNGEYLDWENGFPLMTCWPGQGIPASIRWVNEIERRGHPARGAQDVGRLDALARRQPHQRPQRRPRRDLRRRGRALQQPQRGGDPLQGGPGRLGRGALHL